jgi:transcriptional regulator with XRE-family HTH domain
MRMHAKIEWLLHERRIRQTELESRLGLPHGRISKWRAGQGEPTARQALAMARVLGCDLVWLVDEDQPVEVPVLASERSRTLADVIAGLGEATALRRLIGASTVDVDSLPPNVTVIPPLPSVPNHTARPSDRSRDRKGRSG